MCCARIVAAKISKGMSRGDEQCERASSTESHWSRGTVSCKVSARIILLLAIVSQHSILLFFGMCWYTNFLHVAFVLHVVQFLEMAPPALLECQPLSNIDVFFPCMLLVPLRLFLRVFGLLLILIQPWQLLNLGCRPIGSLVYIYWLGNG